MIAFGDHSHGYAVPLLQRARSGFLSHRDWRGISQQIAQHHGDAWPDITDLRGGPGFSTSLPPR